MKLAAETDADSFSHTPYGGYIARFAEASDNLMRTMEGFGVEVQSAGEHRAERERVRVLRDSLVSRGARLRNGGKSLVCGPLSPACARCRTGVRSVSTFLSLACDRDCWFCFNPNQHDYERYRHQAKDWRAELEDLADRLGGLDFIALTGGEPLLDPEVTLDFICYARSLAPDSHIRLYTSGGAADGTLMERLAQAGLDEVRFSIKLEDDPGRQQAVRGLMREAAGSIPAVMVEMPVIPGTGASMAELLEDLDRLGIFGMNLLELCFPLHNAEAFRERGLKLKRHPYRVPYSYGYAGALPVAGSEELALGLMDEAMAGGTSLSLHWCSLENKNTAQIYGQNAGGAWDIPPYRFSLRSLFYEVVRAFGEDAAFCRQRLEGGIHPFELDDAGTMIAFDPAALALFAPEDAARHRLWLASAVVEEDGRGKRRFREVGLAALEPEDLADGGIGAPVSFRDEDGL